MSRHGGTYYRSCRSVLRHSAMTFKALSQIVGREMSNEINHDRQIFLRNSAMTVAVAGFSAIGPAIEEAGELNQKDPAPIKPGGNTSFASPRQIDAGLLNVGYAEAGPADGRAVILLHGWPYDIHSYIDVAPLLASAGYRVIVPYLRGLGRTRSRSAFASRRCRSSKVKNTSGLRTTAVATCRISRERVPRVGV